MQDHRKEFVVHAQCRRVRSAVAVAALIALAGNGSPAAGASCVAKSGPRTLALVELYTSEGCDSCPPADRWLSMSFPPDAARADAIALAFHVDYWDRLGWKDRFATPAWTRRQYAAAHAGRSDLVYTPQVLVQGRNVPDWRAPGKSKAAIVAAGERLPRAELALEVTSGARSVTAKANARVPGGEDRNGAQLFIALADSGLVSEVRAGENAGARLTHDHVVRALSGGIGADARGDIAADIVLPLPAEAGTLATVVAFVQNMQTGDILQVVAVPLACVPVR